MSAFVYDTHCVREKSLGEMAELVEGARLEIVYTGNRIKGSNPFLSAKNKEHPMWCSLFFIEILNETNITE